MPRPQHAASGAGRQPRELEEDEKGRPDGLGPPESGVLRGNSCHKASDHRPCVGLAFTSMITPAP